ncbi:MAG: hypothetical protein QOK44_2323 [Betaproteobacteria bacterium]|nr:hypothetical protein [Betaproteobacteria bacterium]
MLKTIRLINLEHDVRPVARLNPTLANASLCYEIRRVNILAALTSEMMSESHDVVMNDLCPSDIDGANVLGHVYVIKPDFRLFAVALADENPGEYLRGHAADCVFVGEMQLS